MKNIQVTLKGADILSRQLKQLEKAGLKARKRALLAAGNVIRDAARARVRVRTGKLRGTIFTKINPEGTEAKIGPSKRGYYGVFLELGTKKMPAYPFLKPAYENSREEAIAKLAEAEREELSKL